MKDMKVFLSKKKKAAIWSWKIQNLKNKRKQLVEYRKKYYNMKKTPHYNSKKLTLKVNELESSFDVLKNQFWSYKFTSGS